MLSVTIVAKDAQKLIARAIKSVHSLADEMVVVLDDRTSDMTGQVARELGAKVYIRRFDDFAGQKNFAAVKCHHEWILSLDADEEISPELATEIKRTMTTTTYNGFFIPRLNYIWGKAIYHTNWEPEADSHIWLWRKKYGKWAGRVHEEVIVKGEVGKMNGYKIHHNYQSVEQFIDKMNTYTSLEHNATNPLYEFGRRYVWHKGFLDGWHGLFLSYLQAIYHVCVWVKLKAKTGGTIV